MTDTVENNI